MLAAPPAYVQAEAPAAQPAAYDPYAQVSWGQDIRCKTAFHTHTDVIESRIRAYDDAGYCAVSFHHYTGLPGQSNAWKVVHWPPEQWLSTGFLASLQNIQVLIPDGEHPGWDHFTSPFLTSYLECYQDATSRFREMLAPDASPPPAHPLWTDDQNTWDFGLDRLALAVASSDDAGAFEGRLAAADIEGDDAALVGRFLDFVRTLRRVLAEVAAPVDANAWTKRVDGVLEEMTRTPDEEAWQGEEVRG